MLVKVYENFFLDTDKIVLIELLESSMVSENKPNHKFYVKFGLINGSNVYTYNMTKAEAEDIIEQMVYVRNNTGINIEGLFEVIEYIFSSIGLEVSGDGLKNELPNLNIVNKTGEC